MSLLERFQREVKHYNWWDKNKKVLIAVSGGVDSMALFHLMQHLPRDCRPQMVVAHVNHKLREQADKEEQFVLKMCQHYQVPFFLATWDEGRKQTGNIEQAARIFRYRFFERIMKQEKIDMLLTAHHQSDQVETVLMRLINGNRLTTLVGIKKERAMSCGKIIRPLLDVKKKELYAFMNENQYAYYEDISNKGCRYFRNRVRNKLLPKLREENKQVDEHLLEFHEELTKGLAIIEEVIAPLYNNCVEIRHDTCEINVTLWQTYSTDIQHFMMNKLIDYLQDELRLPVSKRTQLLMEKTLGSHLPNKQISLKGGWCFEKYYQKAVITKKGDDKKKQETSVWLTPNQGAYLSKTQWIGYYKENQFEIPDKVKSWAKKEISIKLNEGEQLLIRKKQAGDCLIINEFGQSKKISRYFIDEKIPVFEREKSWIVEGEDHQVKWLLPFRGSYLSIRSETDKIYNKLVYYYLDDK